MKSKILKFVSTVCAVMAGICILTSAHALDEILPVDPHKIKLSPKFMLDSYYLTSPEIKEYLITRMEEDQILRKEKLREIRAKKENISFFCFVQDLYDSKKRIRLRFWVPADVRKRLGTGVLYCVRLEYIHK